MAFIQTGTNPKTGEPLGYYRTSKDQYPSNKKKKKMSIKTDIFKIKKKGK
jgi:hypothetical protein